jgi:enoyl-CoA hydratase/carnithine racemase
MDLALSGENIDADEVLRIGLVTHVTGLETLLGEADAYAHRLAAYPRVGVGWTKIGIHRAMDTTFEEAIRLEAEAELACFQSAATRDRFRAFIERKRR